MRIIAGTLKSMSFKSSTSKLTHPMSEKMRGAIFSSIGDINGFVVLDAFSGTGALTLEAVSRGADFVTAIETNPKNVELIKQNILNLGLKDHTKVIRASVESWLNRGSNDFDLVLIDPPYNNIEINTILELATRVKDGGILALSWPGRLSLPQFNRLKLVKSKRFGDSQYALYVALEEALTISTKRNAGKNNIP